MEPSFAACGDEDDLVENDDQLKKDFERIEHEGGIIVQEVVGFGNSADLALNPR